MSNEWMKEFVYQVVINQKYLNENLIRLYNLEINKRFPPWDPMGALA